MNTNDRGMVRRGTVCAVALVWMGALGCSPKSELPTRTNAALADGSDEDERDGLTADGPSGEDARPCEDAVASPDTSSPARAAQAQPAFTITKHGKLGRYGEQAVAFVFEDAQATVLQRDGALLSIPTQPPLAKATAHAKAQRRLRRVRSFTQGASFGCAHLKDGSVRCWGEQVGDYGSEECPDEDAVYAYGERPQRIHLPKTVNALGSGLDLSCASSHEGIHCWGGRFGGSDDNPKLLKATRGYTLRAVTNRWVCAENAAGGPQPATVECWRVWRSSREQEPSLSLKDTLLVHGADDHICAFTQGHQLVCYDDDTPQAPSHITGLPKDKEAVEIQGNAYIGCARLSDNTAWCWGSAFGADLKAFEVPKLGTITALIANDEHGPICALREDTSVWCIDD